MFTAEQIKDTARQYAYSLHSKDMAMSLGCETIEDVEYQEMIGALPAGTSDNLSMYGDMPSRVDKQRHELLRDFLFVDNEYIDEEQLAESFESPHFLQVWLSKQGPEVMAEYIRLESEVLDTYFDEENEDDLY
jgi:hypothetical protein